MQSFARHSGFTVTKMLVVTLTLLVFLTSSASDLWSGIVVQAKSSSAAFTNPPENTANPQPVTPYTSTTSTNLPPVNFETAQTYSLSVKLRTRSISADFNKDGNNDIAFGVANPAAIAVMFGNGNATFQNPVTYTVGTPIDRMAQADFNKDNQPDILTINTNNSMSIFLGISNGTFQSATTYSITNPSSFSLNPIIADFNNDGNLDVIVTSFQSFRIFVLLGNGDGTFQPATSYLTNMSIVSLTGGVDFNNDGKADLVVAGTKVTILFGNGDGTFQPDSNSYPINERSDLVFVVVGDFNGDGKSDIVVDDAIYGYLTTLLGNNDGTFQIVYSDSHFGGDTQILLAGDFNGDNKTDLILFYRWVQVLFSNGNGTFQNPTLYPTDNPSNVPSDILFTDVNNDGLKDMIIFNTDNIGSVYSYSILVNKNNTHFSAPIGYSYGSSAVDAVIADFNQDGKPDVVKANANFTLSLFLNRGDGTLLFPTDFTITTGTIQNVNTADFNKDNLPDLVSVAGSNFEVLLGHGDGTFQLNTYSTTIQSPTGLITGDFNKDGNLDIVIGDLNSNNVLLFAGNGDGTFQSPVTINAGSASDVLKTGDINGDGNLDILLAKTGTSSIQVILGNGNGTFQAPQRFSLGSQKVTSMLLGDFDEDGRVDLVNSSSYSGTVTIFLGDGKGGFGAGTTYNVSLSNYRLAAGDFNGDGLLDLAGAGSDCDILLGNGDGTFQPGKIFATTGMGGGWGTSTKLAVGDLNSDGNLDVVLPNGMLTVYLNTGVMRGSATHFRLTTPLTVNSEQSFTLTVQALSSFDTLSTDYTGTVQFGSTDSLAFLPNSYTFNAADNGSHSFSVTLQSVGTQVITATDQMLNAIQGTQTVAVVTNNPATHFKLSASQAVTAGQPFSLTVQALSVLDTLNTNYTGTIQFTSTDVAASLPNSYTFSAADSGSHVFSVTLQSPSNQIITATDQSANPLEGSLTLVSNCAIDPLIVNQGYHSGVNSCNSLGLALQEANQATQPVTITFSANQIPIYDPLPVISNTNGYTVTIDGGCSIQNGRGFPQVTFSAASSNLPHGLILTNGVVVKGLVVQGFGGYAFTLLGDNNEVSCNWIGSNTAGLSGANSGGIQIGIVGTSAANNNQIGHPGQPASGNLISGNNGYGIVVNNGTNNLLSYNWFGLTPDGTGLSPNTQGAILVKKGGQVRFLAGNRIN